MSAKPRVLLVARTRYELPLSPGLARKFDALRDAFELRVLAAAADGRARDDGVFRLTRRLPLLDGPLFYALLPLRVRALAREHRPDAIVTQSPYEAAFVRFARIRAKVIVEIHGDWHTSTRLYGSPLRRALAPLGDRIADRAVRRADAARPVSEFTASLVRALGREPAAVFTTYVDLDAFSGPPVPLPPEPRLLFVGVLEPYKNVETLAAAWRLAAPRAPEALLRLVGRGSRTALVQELLRDLPGRTEWDERLTQEQVAAALDASRALVLPSASEGLPRIAMEAFRRGRPVIGARAGGIPDIVEDGVNGLLVPPGDPAALATAIERIATEPGLAERLADGARDSAPRWTTTPEQYAGRMRELVDAVLAGSA